MCVFSIQIEPTKKISKKKKGTGEEARVKGEELELGECPNKNLLLSRSLLLLLFIISFFLNGLDCSTPSPDLDALLQARVFLV
jgi:hypothetical protein